MRRTARSFAGRAAFVTAVATALILTGCSSDDGSDGPSTGPTSAAPTTSEAPEPVTIEMSWWGNEERAALFAQVIDLFEAEYPWITVTESPVPDPDTLFNRLATDFGAGGDTAPDVFALGGAKPQEYGGLGALMDLSTVSEWLDTSKYPDFSLTNAIVDGTLYGLPTGGNASATFINTAIFEKAGVAVPDDDWTWQDFVDAANAIGSKGLTTDAGAPIMGVDLRVQDIIGTYVGQKTEFGFYDWDGKLSTGPEPLVDWLKIEQALQAGKGLPDATIVTQNWNISTGEQPFTLGQAGITFGYSNLVGTYGASGANPLKVVLPPHDAGDTAGVALLPSAFWSINAATKHPQEAALLVDWFLNQPAAAELIKDTRGIPFNPDTLAVVSPLLTGDAAVVAEYVNAALESGTVAPPQPDGGANLNLYAQDMESSVLFGQATPEAAADTFIQKLGADLSAAQG